MPVQRGDGKWQAKHLRSFALSFFDQRTILKLNVVVAVAAVVVVPLLSVSFCASLQSSNPNLCARTHHLYFIYLSVFSLSFVAIDVLVSFGMFNALLSLQLINQSANFTDYESWHTDMDSSGGGLDHSAESNVSSSDNDRLNSSPDNPSKTGGGTGPGGKFHYVRGSSGKT